MRDESHPIDWKIPYPENCTRDRLTRTLRELAAHWSGWDDFPWYLTRTLHRHHDNPPADWDHLHARFWMMGHAAHILLHEKFADRNALLETLIRNEVQFAGMFRHIALDNIRWCLIYKKQDRLPDCALWGADTPENRASVEHKRAEFRDGIEQSVSEFVRVLDFASIINNPAERIAGLPLHTWFKGAHMPDPAQILVHVCSANNQLCLQPDTATAARFLSRRLPIPSIKIRANGTAGAGVQATPLPHGETLPSDAVRKPTDEDEEASRKIAFRVFELAARLDGNGKREKRPTHALVLKLYCCDDQSVSQIAKKCGCSHGTVMNRKNYLEKTLGTSLDTFRRHSEMMTAAAKTLEDGRAQNIYRRGLANGQ